MPAPLTPDVYQDDMAISLARVITVANKHARDLGVDVMQSLVTLTQRPLDDGVIWRVSYGPKDYRGRRGGDLIIDVEPADASIRQVLRGQ